MADFSKSRLFPHPAKLGKMSFSSGPEPSGAYVSRLNGASKMMLEAAISNRDYWEHSYMYGVESAYESLFQQLSYRRYKGTPRDFLVNLHIGVMDLYKSLSRGIERAMRQIKAAGRG